MIVALAACSSGAAPTAVPQVLLPQLPAASAPQKVTASVRVVPASVANLSFVVSAPVKEIKVVEGESVRAGQALVVLDSPQLELALTAAEAALQSAEADDFIQSQGRRKWNGFKNVWVAGSPEQRQVAHAKVVQAQAGLAAAQAELAQATLVAPFDGAVVSVEVSAGEVVQAGQVVLVTGDLTHLRIETTDCSEGDIARVHIGQAARVRLKALTSELNGRVSAIQPLAGESPDGDVIYKVTIELDRQSPELLWGMSGEVEIETRR